jgi:hypothetical protein
MPLGAIECRGTWLRQRGEMRLAPGRPWLSFEAEQWLAGSGIDFRWKARLRMGPLVRARVIDAFEGGIGSLSARVLGFPVARATGPATDRGEALRGLAELPWRPFAFREAPQFRFEEPLPDRLRATFHDGRTQATVELEIDASGRVLGGAASSRPRLVGSSVVETAWSGTFGEYRLFDRLRVPTMAEAVWQLPEGPFPYWRGRIADFRVLR